MNFFFLLFSVVHDKEKRLFKLFLQANSSVDQFCPAEDIFAQLSWHILVKPFNVLFVSTSFIDPNTYASN